MKKLKYLFLSSLILLTPFSAQASEFQSGEQIFIGSDKVENTYLAGAVVDVSADIDGDLIVGGAMVSISSNISDDATIAGSQVSIDGAIGGDLRAAASTLDIDSQVSGEALIGASIVRISRNSLFGSDARVGGTLIIADGTYSGPVTLAGQEITFIGSAEGDVTIKAETIGFAEGASIAGNLTIESPTMPEIGEGVVAGEVNYTQVEYGKKEKMKGFGLEELFASMVARNFTKSISLFATALFFLFFFHKLSVSVVEGMKKNFWKSAGIGFLVQIGLFLASVILLFTIVGGGISMLLFSSWGILHYVARAMTAIFIGSFILAKWHNKHSNSWFKILIALIGALSVFALSIIPVIGWIVVTLILLASAGSFAIEFSEKVLKKQ